MRKLKNAWKQLGAVTLALALTATMALPVTGRAEENAEALNGVNEEMEVTETGEEVPKVTAEENVMPSIGITEVEYKPGTKVEIPIASWGSGAYATTLAECRDIFDASGNLRLDLGRGNWVTKESNGKLYLEMSELGVNSFVEKGVYTMEVRFSDEGMPPTFRDGGTVKINVPQTIEGFKSLEYDKQFDGLKDIAIRFQNAAGSAAIKEFTGVYVRLYEVGSWLDLETGSVEKDFAYDLGKGEFTLKADYINKNAEKVIEWMNNPHKDNFVEVYGEVVLENGKTDTVCFGSLDFTKYDPNNIPDKEEENKPSTGEDTDKPTTGEGSDKPSTEGNVTTVDSQKEAVSVIKNSNAKDTVVIEMNNTTTVQKDVLAAAKGKDVDVVLNMDGYTWIINGKNITSDNLKNINLEARFVKNAIPQKVLNKLVGNNPAKQLSLTHDGEFGFEATLRINVGKEYANQYANLFYYNKDKKFEFMNAGTINAVGLVDLKFSHASDYVVEISDEVLSQDNVPADLQPGNDKNGGVPKTGDTLPVMSSVVMMLLALGVITMYGLKSKVKREN